VPSGPLYCIILVGLVFSLSFFFGFFFFFFNEVSYNLDHLGHFIVVVKFLNFSHMGFSILHLSYNCKISQC
jgi:hypothetical protein